MDASVFVWPCTCLSVPINRNKGRLIKKTGNFSSWRMWMYLLYFTDLLWELSDLNNFCSQLFCILGFYMNVWSTQIFHTFKTLNLIDSILKQPGPLCKMNLFCNEENQSGTPAEFSSFYIRGVQIRSMRDVIQPGFLSYTVDRKPGEMESYKNQIWTPCFMYNEI